MLIMTVAEYSSFKQTCSLAFGAVASLGHRFVDRQNRREAQEVFFVERATEELSDALMFFITRSPQILPPPQLHDKRALP